MATTTANTTAQTTTTTTASSRTPFTTNTLRAGTRNRFGSFLALAALVVAGCATNAPTAEAQLGSTGKTTKIELKKLKFTPKSVQVRIGDKIDFVWKETVAHNIVFKGGPKSKTLNKGTWSTKFDKAGTYKYKCTLHPGMDGSIVVK